MTTTNIAIIGAGQLGSRHLQGLKKAQVPMNIYVLDASKEALAICEQRYNEIAKNELVEHILFTTQWESLPDSIDIAIVATGSKPRCAIIYELVKNYHCHQLILEKFLFPTMNQYDEISKLFRQNKVQAWVNCSRRYFDGYHILRQLLINDGPIHLVMKGKNWGLCCNSIHFIDLFAYLSGAKQIDFDCSGIDSEIYESKRSGYIEMTGTIKGIADNGSTLQLSSYAEYESNVSLTMKSQHHDVKIFEGQNKMVVDGIEHEMNMTFQSNLTGKYIEDLLCNKTLPLATYEESANLHLQVLPHFQEIYNKITGTQSDLCPIT
jgi:hypothetical protein